MRLNFKKVLLVSVILLFIWVLVSYSSVIEVPRAATTQNPISELESKLNKLQQQMDDQMIESNILLQKVKKHLKTNAISKEENEDDKLDNVLSEYLLII